MCLAQVWVFLLYAAEMALGFGETLSWVCRNRELGVKREETPQGLRQSGKVNFLEVRSTGRAKELRAAGGVPGRPHSPSFPSRKE